MGNARNLADNLPVTGQLSGRNMVQNGAFIVDQRREYAAHTIVAGSNKFCDRWGFYSDSGATNKYGATAQVVDDGPSGFEKSFKFTITSNSGAIPATSEVIFRHVMEGYQTNRLDFGTANAKNATLSFWVKSSIAGNYGFTVQYVDSGGTNLYNLRSYTVNSANTWEYKTITIPKNTANGIQQKTSGVGFRLNFDLGEGATYSGSVTGNWQSAYVNGLSGGVKIANTNGATWQLTGVMLEEGDQASPFEYEDYSRTLSTCQRYFYRWYSSGLSDNLYISTPYASGTPPNTSASVAYTFPVTMRVNPTMTAISGSAVSNLNRFTSSVHNATAQHASTSSNAALSLDSWTADADF